MKCRVWDLIIFGSIWIVITLLLKSGFPQLIGYTVIVATVVAAFFVRKNDR